VGLGNGNGNSKTWIQVLAMALTAGGMIGLATWTLSTQINAIRTDDMAQLAVLQAKIAAVEARNEAIEKTESGHYTDDVSFRTEMRGAVNSVISSLADVRVAVGAHHGQPR